MLKWKLILQDDDHDADPLWQPLHAARVYEHVKPTGQEPAVDAQLPELRPQLRPYQRRAASWMVAREQGQTHVRRICKHLPRRCPAGLSA